MRRTREFNRTAAAILLLGQFACGGEGGDPTFPSEFVGIYTLATVNGSALPVQLSFGLSLTDVVDVTAGSLELTGDGSYTMRLTFEADEDGAPVAQNQQDFGRASVSGSTIALTSDSSDARATGTVTVNRVEISSGGATFTFER